MPKSKASDQLAQMAKKKILSLCIGNGLRKTDISFSNFDGKILNFQARTVVRPEIDAKIHTRSGRVKGDKTFNSRQALDQELVTLKKNLADNDKILEKIVGQIQQRRDKGIGITGEAINLKTLDQSYVAHESCQICDASGHTTCPKCRGQKNIPCIRCKGRNMVQCAVCSGRGKINGQDGAPQTCPRCNGKTQVPCDYCKGKGKIACDRCQGKSGIPCESCKGAGVNSEIAQVKMKANIDGEFIIEDLEPDIAAKVARTGPGLITKKLAKIKSMDKGKTDDALPVLTYQLTMPYAEMTLKLAQNGKNGKSAKQSGNARETSARLIGYRPQFLEIEPLLDNILEPVIKYAGSSAARFSALKTLQKTGRYKIFREAMVLTAKGSVNAARDKIQAKYAPLVSPEKIESIALVTNGLLNKATEKPSNRANWIVCVLMLVMFGGYFLGPGQAYLTEAIRQVPTLTKYADFTSWVVLLVALILTGPLHKIFARALFKMRIGKLLPAQYSAALLQKLKRFHLTPYVLTALSFALFYVGVEVLDFRL